MSRIQWGVVGERFVEAGVDRGVLFVGSDSGVPWNGLQSVNETISGGEAQPFYMDGIKYLNIAADEEFAATINALSAPAEFGPCDGTAQVAQGLFITQQPRIPFGLSYRTKVGNDILGLELGYKIHLVYGALAAPSPRNNQSLGANSTPMILNWTVTTTPDRVPGRKPSAHLVVDSRLTDPEVLSELEDFLYGTNSTESALPTTSELIDIFGG